MSAPLSTDQAYLVTTVMLHGRLHPRRTLLTNPGKTRYVSRSGFVKEERRSFVEQPSWENLVVVNTGYAALG